MKNREVNVYKSLTLPNGEYLQDCLDNIMVNHEEERSENVSIESIVEEIRRAMGSRQNRVENDLLNGGLLVEEEVKQYLLLEMYHIKG